MADKKEIEYITFEQGKAKYPFYNQFSFYDYLYKKGKNPCILHIDLEVDTLSTGGGLIEVAPPTNDPADFATGQQCYLRSSEAGDTSKTCRILGQEHGEEFGWTTLTTDASDGTDFVDIGLWDFIMFAEKIDTCAGNLIIDDDHASGTVYYTLTLGATPDVGIIYVPKGKIATVLAGNGHLEAAPSNVNASDNFNIGKTFGFSLNSYNPNGDKIDGGYAHEFSEDENIPYLADYKGAAATVAYVGTYIVMWDI